MYRSAGYPYHRPVLTLKLVFLFDAVVAITPARSRQDDTTDSQPTSAAVYTQTRVEPLRAGLIAAASFLVAVPINGWALPG